METKNKVKVRFAPSPTGFLHMGNARMAVLNYLLAKKLNGEFLLRIDDTDTKRSQEEYTVAIKDALKWLGVSWSEEFRQSNRLDVYNDILQKLEQEGRVYKCYETPEELEYAKNLQLAKKLPPIYNRSALSLTKEQKEQYVKEGRKPYYRFKIEPGEIAWNDICKGHLSFKGEHLSDPVIVREDGSFLYILTSVIDDAEKKITHILRGEDHIVNTAVQIQMFKCLNAPIPQFAHMPIVTNTEGKKLSKRDGDFSISDLQKQGYLPLSIIYTLFSLGLGDHANIYTTIEEIIEHFDISKYGKATAQFDSKKLAQNNLHLLKLQPFEKIKNMSKEFLNLGICENFYNKVKNNIEQFSDIKLWHDIVFEDITSSVLEKKELLNKEVLEITLATLPKVDFTLDTWGMWQKDIKEKLSNSYPNINSKTIFTTLRVALTGLTHGMEFKDLLILLGLVKTKERLFKAIDILK
jgi:glutamyl-tRNA synthetase